MTATWECDALDAAGTPVHIRPIGAGDTAALIELHRGLSPETVYFRFFGVHPELSQEEAEHFTHVDGHDRAALVALVGGRLVAVGRYDRYPGTGDAEVAFVVADAHQGHGIGTLLLELAGIDRGAAQAVLDRIWPEPGEPRWLRPTDATELLRAYGIECLPTGHAATVDDAVHLARRIGYPVALKTADPDVVHKTDLGAVQLDIRNDRQLRRAAATITAALGRPAGFVVQPMVDTGVEMIAGITHDPAFGPLVMVGAGGVHAELLGDRRLRILPLTDRDAAEAIRSLRLAPLLFGYRSRPRIAVDRLEDLLLRLARVAEDTPEIAELDCNPVLLTPTAAQVVDAKVRLARPTDQPPDHLRRLR